jgi:hypothetical protein
MAQYGSTAEPTRAESARCVAHVAGQRSKILRLVNSGPTAIRLMFSGQIMRFATVTVTRYLTQSFKFVCYKNWKIIE